MADLKQLEENIAYEFRDKDLLINALTHSSYASEHGLDYSANNERLEFIGDGYLDAIIGTKLFEIMDKAHEGILSKKRADVVREGSLAAIARKISLGDHIRLGKGENAGGGRNKDSVLADAMEALIGATILDGGFDRGRDLVLRLFDDTVRLAVEGKLYSDYKSRLQEILQDKYKNINISYSVIGESGPDHDKTFSVSVLVNGKVLGSGTGKSKAKAEQAAAADVLSKGEIELVF